MTKASVIKSQTGQDETLLKTGRQKKEMQKRRDSERQKGRGLKCKRGIVTVALQNTIKVSSFFVRAINYVLM